MIIGLLISLLSVSYSVVSSNSVSVGGEAPAGSTAVYSRSSSTGQKGQMTRGNSTTLLLSGWDGCRIDSVVLRMRSNTSQGAGCLQMHIGALAVWEIADNDFSHPSWYGSFTTDWVDISHCIGRTVGSGEVIQIAIEASENSLYIQSYTLYYSAPVVEAHEVRFVTGIGTPPLSMREDSIGLGIVLPSAMDSLSWRFVGWSEREVSDTIACEGLLLAGTRYYPACDCCLWGVYCNGDGSFSSVAGVSGDYMLAHSGMYWCAAMCGSVTNGEVATKSVSILSYDDDTYELLSGVADDMIYSIDFLSDSTLTIRHKETGEQIGYSGTKLANRESVWRYHLLSDNTYAIYYQDAHLYRMLRFGDEGSSDAPRVVAYARRVEMSLLKENGLLLFPKQLLTFSSWPFGRVEEDKEEEKEEETEVVKGEFLMRFGSYLLQVKDGVKQLVVGR